MAVIQGTVDVEDEIFNLEEIARIFDFCGKDEFGAKYDPEEMAKEVGLPLETVERYRSIILDKNVGTSFDDFENGAVDGLRPSMKLGELGLVHAC